MKKPQAGTNGMFHGSRMYNFVRSCQLDGTYAQDPPAPGTWTISSMRVSFGWGAPSEAEWPYDTGRWPPVEPPGMDEAAKSHRIGPYQRVRNVEQCKRLLAHERPPSVSIAIDGSHCVLLVGYDDHTGLLSFRNSWGAGWGDKGYGYLPYSYFGEYCFEAWTTHPNRPLPVGKSIARLSTATTDYLSSDPLLCFELFDASRDECLAWAFVAKRDGYADIEEFFVRPAYRGRGIGRELAKMILERAHFQAEPLRLWVSHADGKDVDATAVQHVLTRLGVAAKPASDCRWAAFVAV